MKIIGVTGGVGAGKSEILNALASDWKAVIVKADEVGHLVMEPSGSCYQPIIQLFGKDVVASDGKLDRAKIAACVFGNKELLEQLNAIVHPAVKAYIKNAIKQEQEKNTPIFVVEAALLIEDHYDEICDELWYIYADEATRAQRLQEHRGYSKEKIAGIFRKIYKNLLAFLKKWVTMKVTETFRGGAAREKQRLRQTGGAQSQPRHKSRRGSRAHSVRGGTGGASRLHHSDSQPI